jgi:DNA-binding response OmpR family regulator
MEILVVEDGLLDAQLTLEALKHCGIHYRANLLRTVAEAKEFLGRQGVYARAPVPDLVLLDLVLLDGEGLEVLQFVRAEPEIAELTVVVMTSSQDEGDRDACRSMHVDDYILKPFDIQQFHRVVREHRRLSMFGTSSARSP